MFDPESFAVNGVSLMFLVFGLVEFFKAQFPAIQGRWATLFSAVLAAGMGLMFKAMPLMSEPAAMWIGYVLEALAFGLAASGFYKYIQKKVD